ncbi:unnamed protein product [Thlaspi arvense]|uniref:shikimate kinase n=1 Tax=Thlaspi arvense TaxID=13288 RepID=A0AAU9SVE2_THLAR|nr:unnamed protein product [Thlaspi arvense]
MDLATVQRFQYSSSWIDRRSFEGKPRGSLRYTQRIKEDKRLRVLALAHFQPEKTRHHRQRSVSDKNSSGMMGSGKTTVGKIMARALGYTFFDCDALIEQAMNGTTVAEIFEHFGESVFREKETEAIKKLSLMYQKVVVSTGGGAVMRPINWKYMHKGVSIWLDVPLEALAQRIAAVGTASRPLLHDDESGDSYTVALNRLSTIWDARGEAYTNASARVSLENITSKLGYRNVSDLTPTEIAIEAFEQVQSFLEKEDGMARPGGL